MGEICSEHDGSFPWQVVMGGATIRQERARSALVFLKRSERMFFVQMEKIRALMTGRLDLSVDVSAVSANCEEPHTNSHQTRVARV